MVKVAARQLADDFISICKARLGIPPDEVLDFKKIPVRNILSFIKLCIYMGFLCF